MAPRALHNILLQILLALGGLYIPATVADQECPSQPSPSLPEGIEMAMGCRHGNFLVMQGDKYVGPSLKTSGEWAEGEIQQVFRYLVSEGSVVVDVGANIGAHTIPLARLAGKTGVVHAMECIPTLYNLIITNAVMNGLGNVRGHNAFAGETSSSTRRRVLNANALYDPLKPSQWMMDRDSWPLNFGNLNIHGSVLDRLDGTFAVDRVPTVAIDDLNLYACALIKIDVEGAELEVIRGAVQTIRQYEPAIYLEDDRGEESSQRITSLLASLQYACQPHRVPVYNNHNYKDGDPWDREVAWVHGRAVTSAHNQLCMSQRKLELFQNIVNSWGIMPYGAPREGEEPRKAVEL